MTLGIVILIIGGVLSALSAGLFFIFSNTVIPSLRELPAKQHITAMQVINDKIVNPFFLLTFMGPAFLLPIAAFMLRDGGSEFPVLLLAAALQIIGVNAVTIMGNVPLNNQLETVNVNQLSEAEAEKVRQDYNGIGARWMQLQSIRTAAIIAVNALVLVAAYLTQVPQ